MTEHPTKSVSLSPAPADVAWVGEDGNNSDGKDVAGRNIGDSGAVHSDDGCDLAGSVKRVSEFLGKVRGLIRQEGLTLAPDDLRAILAALAATASDREVGPEGKDEAEQANHDCLAKRRHGEPMFILLGRDPDAHNIVQLWADRRLAAGGDPDHCRLAYDTAERMKAYAADPENAPRSAPQADEYEELAPVPSAPQAGVGGQHTAIMDALHGELTRQKPEAFTEEDGNATIAIPAKDGWVTLDVSSLAEVVLALPVTPGGSGDE